MNTPRILYVEDDANDVSLLQATLEAQSIPAEIIHVTTAESFLSALSHKKPALILADSNVPRFGAFEALKLTRERLPEIPFFCLTGAITAAASMAMHEAGANGCLCKDDLTAVGLVIQGVNDSGQSSEIETDAAAHETDRSETNPFRNDTPRGHEARRPSIPILIGNDAKLLFALLDAAADEGRLRSPSLAARWQQAKNRFIAAAYDGDGSAFWIMLDELDQAGWLDGSWILRRWRTVKARMGGASTATDQ